MNTIQRFELMLDEMDNQLMKMNKKEKYPMGYLLKIQYWQDKCSQYLNEGDVSNYYMALAKVKYFQHKNQKG